MGSCCQYINSNNEIQFNLAQEILKEREKKLKNKNSSSKLENYLINSYRGQLSTNTLKKNGTLNSNIESTTFNSQIQNNIIILINKLREDPLSFIPIIDKYSQMIQFNTKKKHYYIIIKIYLKWEI